MQERIGYVFPLPCVVGRFLRIFWNEETESMVGADECNKTAQHPQVSIVAASNLTDVHTLICSQDMLLLVADHS